MLRQSRTLAVVGVVVGALLANSVLAEDPPAKTKAAPQSSAKPAQKDVVKETIDKAAAATQQAIKQAEKSAAEAAKKADKAAATTDKAAAKADKAADKADKAGDKADKAAAKADEKTDKAAGKLDKAADKADKAADKADKSADKAERALSGEDSTEEKGAHPGGVRDLIASYRSGKLKKEELKERLANLKDSRKERRQRHREELKKRWGRKLASPACLQELRHHARRKAILDRMLVVAETEHSGKDSEKLTARIDKLVDQENSRHEKKMAALGGAAQGGAQ